MSRRAANFTPPQKKTGGPKAARPYAPLDN
jgi:hypothetical protein